MRNAFVKLVQESVLVKSRESTKDQLLLSFDFPEILDADLSIKAEENPESKAVEKMTQGVNDGRWSFNLTMAQAIKAYVEPYDNDSALALNSDSEDSIDF